MDCLTKASSQGFTIASRRIAQLKKARRLRERKQREESESAQASEEEATSLEAQELARSQGLAAIEEVHNEDHEEAPHHHVDDLHQLPAATE